MFESVEKSYKILKEIARVLKLKGGLLISTPNQKSLFLRLQSFLHLPRFHDWSYVETHLQLYDPEKLDILLKDYGFKIIRKARFIAFPPFRMTKNAKVFPILMRISKLVPENLQELIIRLTIKV